MCLVKHNTTYTMNIFKAVYDSLMTYKPAMTMSDFDLETYIEQAQLISHLNLTLSLHYHGISQQ